MISGDLIVFVTELARRQFVRREVLEKGFVDASPFLTFTQLRNECVQAARLAGLLDRREVTDAWRAFFLRRAAEHAQARIGNAGRLGVLTLAGLTDTLEALVESLSPFADDAQPIHDWLLAQEPDTGKLHQLGILYSAYRDLCRKEGIADTRDLNAAVLKLLAGATDRWPRRITGFKGKLIFRAIRWLNPFEERFVIALKKRLGNERVVVTSALPPAHAEKVEDRLGARIRSEVMMGSEHAWSGWAENITDALEVSDAQLALDSRDRISFSCSAGLYGEVEDLSRRIRWEIERGVAPERIALVARNLSDYADAITNVFDRFGIPYFFRRGLPASSLPQVKAFLSLLSLPLTMDRDRFCALLQNSALRWKGFCDEQERRQAAHDLLSAGARPRLSANTARGHLEMYYAGPDSPLAPDRRKAVTAAIAEHVGRFASRSNAAPLPEHARNAIRLVEEYGLERLAEDESIPLATRITNLRALEASLSIVRELEEATHDDREPRSLAEFIDLLERSLENATISPGRAEESGVWVLNPFDTAGLKFDVVVIAGLDEGVFPAAPRQDSILSDAERQTIRDEMKKRGVELPQWGLPLSTVRMIQESILFLISVGTARERLVLSYQACDTDGRDLVPGDFLRSLWNLAGWPAYEETIELSDYDAWRIEQAGKNSHLALHAAQQERTSAYQRAPMPGESYLATVPLRLCAAADEARQRIARATEDKKVLAEAKAAGLESDVENPLSTNLAESIRRRLEIELARERFFSTPDAERPKSEPFCGKMGGKPVRDIASGWLARHEEFSSTGLETLAKCRYRFLMSQVCRLGKLRTQEDAPDIMDRGKVIHEILERAYRGLSGADPEIAKRFGPLCRAQAWAVESKPGQWRLATGKRPAGARVLPLVTFDPDADYAAFADAVADSVFARAESGEFGEAMRLGDPGVWATEKPKIRQIVRNYLRLDQELAHGEQRYPALFELRFGTGRDDRPTDMPPLRLSGGQDPNSTVAAVSDRRIRRPDFGELSRAEVAATEGQNHFTVLLRGMVDRVDAIFDERGDLAGLLVVDYKTSSKGGKSIDTYTEDIAENLDCQLPVYGFVAQQFFFGRHNEPDINPMTSVAYHIQDREYEKMSKQFRNRRIGLDLVPESQPPLTQSFIQRLVANLGRLKAADFSVDPLDCEYCDFEHICRVDVNAMEMAGSE